jgi:hypothetical protein
MGTETVGSNLRSSLPKAENVTHHIRQPINEVKDPYAVVNDPTDDVIEMNKRWEMTRALMGGTETMRAAAEKFLPREPAESAKAYDFRLIRSVLFNAYGTTVKVSTGRPFSRPIVFNGFNAQLESFNENIDLQGSNIDVFTRAVFEGALAHGHAFILIDHPKRPDLHGTQEDAPSLEQERDMNLRPYWKYVSAYDVIGWRSALVNGVEIPTQVRIRETASQDSGLFGVVKTERVRVLEPGTFTLYEKNPNSGVWGVIDAGVSLDAFEKPLTFIPIVFVSIGTDYGFFKTKPKLLDLAYMNIEHWQSSSDQRNILHVARVPILFGSGFHDDDDLEIGASRWIKGPEGSSLSYIEHSGSSIDAGRVDLETIENRMRVMGAEILVRGRAQVTATEKVLNTDEETSDLQNSVIRFTDALSQAYTITARWMGLEDDTVGDISIYHDFGISANAYQEAQILLQMRLSKQITQEAFLQEMKRRGLLGEDIDIMDEIVLTANELPQEFESGGKPEEGAQNE